LALDAYLVTSLAIPGDLSDRVRHPGPNSLHQVGDLGEATPPLRDWIHEFTRHLSPAIDDKAQYEYEFTLGRELVRRVTLRHVNLIDLIRAQFYPWLLSRK
jgi:hypothetical protein